MMIDFALAAEREQGLSPEEGKLSIKLVITLQTYLDDHNGRSAWRSAFNVKYRRRR